MSAYLGSGFDISGGYEWEIKDTIEGTQSYDTSRYWHWGEVCTKINCGLDLPVAIDITVRGQQEDIEDGEWYVADAKYQLQFEYNISIGGKNYNMRAYITNYEQEGLNYYVRAYLVRDGDNFAVEIRADGVDHLDYTTYKVYLAK